YTSGTTGNPKGVIIEHRSVVNLIDNYARTYSICEEDIILQTTDYCFDPSVQQVFGALTNGSKLCCVRKEVLMDRVRFKEYVIKNYVNIIDLTPALLENLICNSEKIDGIEVTLCGGDRLTNSLKQKLISKGYKLYNHYGPTEFTIDAITYQCDNSTNLNIVGKPISNTKIYILD
ncbi:AMP-binding protein, partial [Bacillus mobilis]|uniref:AMP-binding protein n=1 Tax=Bacillus mobilis TaxID=2026190 RepID=UPI0022E60EF2